VQVAHKNATADEFHNVLMAYCKIQTFFNALKNSSVYVISCIRQPVAQDIDKIHVFVYMRASFLD